MKPGVLQRVVVANALHRIMDEGAYSNIVVGRLTADLDAPQRSAVHHTVLATIRNSIRWDVAIEAAAGRQVTEIDPVVRAVLRALAQELLGDRHAPHGAVDSAVEATAELGMRRARGFVNAVGRRLAEAPVPVRAGDGGFDLGVPQWMFGRVAAAAGAAAARAFFAAANAPAEVGIRLRPGADPPPGYRPVDGIAGAGYVARPVPVGDVDLIDPASTAVVRALDARPGMRVADLAAAPGGKTAAIADAVGAGGTVVAVDAHPRRVDRMRRRLDRLDVKAALVVADARTRPLRPANFDRVLLDAPCTGLGTLRRRPEIRHRVDPADPQRLGALQAELLEAAVSLVAPGGRLVYSVCTRFPEETVDVVAPYDARPPDLPGDVWGKGRLLGPDSTATDGMFVAVLDV